jgi:hypothetical protein
MNKLKTLIIALLCPIFMLAQPPISERKMKQIESQKIAFITNELNLSPEEAQGFWPVYNQYTKARRQYRESRHDNIKNIDLESISEEDAKSSVEFHLKSEEARLEIETKFLNKFIKIIGYKRIISLLVAEEKFKKELLLRIRKRKGGKHNRK